MIDIEDVRSAIISNDAEIVEGYPNDPRGPSCLVLGWTPGGTPLHVVVSYPPEVAVITLYVPESNRWIDFRSRR